MTIEVDSASILTAKRQLVADLKGMLALRLEFGEAIERKAIEVFKFSSALLGVAAGLGIVRQNIRGNLPVGLGYICLVIAYGYHALCMYRVLRPSVYSIAPGIPSNSRSYDDFYQSYIASGEEGYLTQLISDLAGTDTASGAIEDGETINAQKAEYLQQLGKSFVAIIIILLLMGASAVWF
ncbi:MAG TPA: hypothetical protein VKP04_07980 [Ktedonobacteraceae bacterium]|nr:hypothetical protein [Ktedonobacteraceae bacterium]